MSPLSNTEPIELDPCLGGRLEGLADALGLEPFDLLLVGDGSGNTYQQSAGWACTAYDRQRKRVVVHAGAVTAGTNNFAELAPYVHALWFHNQDHGKAVPTPYQVRIVSDSEVTVRCGNGRYTRRANGCLWSAVSWFEGNGYALTWHHVRRGSNGWNEFADALASEARSLIDKVKNRIRVEGRVSKPTRSSRRP